MTRSVSVLPSPANNPAILTLPTKSILCQRVAWNWALWSLCSRLFPQQRTSVCPSCHPWQWSWVQSFDIKQVDWCYYLVGLRSPAKPIFTVSAPQSITNLVPSTERSAPGAGEPTLNSICVSQDTTQRTWKGFYISGSKRHHVCPNNFFHKFCSRCTHLVQNLCQNLLVNKWFKISFRWSSPDQVVTVKDQQRYKV